MSEHTNTKWLKEHLSVFSQIAAILVSLTAVLSHFISFEEPPVNVTPISVSCSNTATLALKETSTNNFFIKTSTLAPKEPSIKSFPTGNSTTVPIGKCGDGTADPQGWWGGVPKCGTKGNWLYDCERKVVIKNLIPTINTFPQTEVRTRECK